MEKERDFGDQRLKVRLLGSRDSDPETWDALEEELHTDGPWKRSLQRADDSGPAVRMVLVPKRDSVPEDDPVPQLGPTEAPMLAVLSETGELMLRPELASAGAAKSMVKSLDRWSNYRYKLALDNPGSSLASTVSIDLKKKVGSEFKSVTEGDAGVPKLQTRKDEFQIHITNTGPDRVWIGLLNFKINGEVSVLRQSWLQGAGPQGPVPMIIQGDGPVEWEGGFPYDPGPFTDSPTEAAEVLKVFITRAETDFHPLSQDAITRSGGAPIPTDNPLQDLLNSPASATRGFSVMPPDGWGTVSLTVMLKAPDELELRPGSGIELGGEGGTKVSLSGASGRLRMGKRTNQNGADRPPLFPEGSAADRLQAVLREQGVHPAQSFSLGDTRSADTRDGGTSALTIDSPQLAEGWGELAMSTDDEGIVRWHFPEAQATTRSGEAPRRTTYRIRPPVFQAEQSAGDDGDAAREAGGEPQTRGFLSSTVGKLFVDRIAFPLIDPMVEMALDLWESRVRPNRVRWLSPTEIGSEEADLAGSEDWRRLEGGRALLFLHGPFSRAHRAFKELPVEFLSEMGREYGDRIFAFDHMTLSEDPRDNVRWFVAQMPAGSKLDIDIVAHSRGGLVARALAESGNDFALDGKSIDVRRVVSAGTPNAGTPMASVDHVKTLLDVFTNLLSIVDPIEVGSIIFRLAQKLATSAVEELPGLHAMAPGSAYLSQQPALRGQTQYYGIASDIGTDGSGGFTKKLFNRVVEGVLGGEPNDLIVPEPSVWGSDGFVTEQKILTGTAACSHLKYFEVPSVRSQIQEWLLREGPPIEIPGRHEGSTSTEETSTDVPGSHEPSVVDPPPLCGRPRATCGGTRNRPWSKPSRLWSIRSHRCTSRTRSGSFLWLHPFRVSLHGFAPEDGHLLSRVVSGAHRLRCPGNGGRGRHHSRVRTDVQGPSGPTQPALRMATGGLCCWPITAPLARVSTPLDPTPGRWSRSPEWDGE